jgi:hypothetical protein
MPPCCSTESRPRLSNDDMQVEEAAFSGVSTTAPYRFWRCVRYTGGELCIVPVLWELL